MKLNEILTELRKENKLTQKELAEKLNVKPATISGYELGTRTPGVDMIEAISDFFNVDTDYLLGKTLVKRRFNFDYLRKENRLEVMLAMISASDNDIDREFLESYVNLDDSKKKALLCVMKEMAKE